MTEISKLFGICYESVRDWIKRYKKDGDYSSKQGVGCGRAVRFTDKNQILEYLKSYPDASGGSCLHIADVNIKRLYVQ